MFNHDDLYFNFLEGEGSAIDSFTSRKNGKKSGHIWLGILQNWSEKL